MIGLPSLNGVNLNLSEVNAKAKWKFNKSNLGPKIKTNKMDA